MKRLHFEYCMEIRYTMDVTRCHYTIKCIPVDNERQKISNLKIEMIPESVPQWGNDALGNRYIYGCNDLPHSDFKYRLTGEAQCGLAEYDSLVTDRDFMLFRHNHGLTVPGYSIRSYFEVIKKETEGFLEMSPLRKAARIMECLYRDFHYEKNCTDVHTTAEEAFSSGRGVCQDYAHICVSLLILAGCSARYVTGLIVGEGASHAWVEVADHGRWYGFDPTNHLLVTDSHIRIGVGRDASECQLNRGIMHGGGGQQQDIFVNVTEERPGQKYLQKGALC